MRQFPWINRFVLGRGGSQTGATVLDVEPPTPRIAQSICAEDRVYAIDVDVERRVLALGTRSGRVDILAADGSAAGEMTRRLTRVLGRPILSVCWVGKSLLAVSDAGGRVCLWHLESEDGPRFRELGVDNDIVCSLVSRDDRLIGLTRRGRIVQWTLPDGEVRGQLEAPPPPARLSLARLQAATEDNGMFFYPSAAGELVEVDTSAGGIRTWEVHEGDLQVVCPLEQGLITLITVGQRNGTAKLWRSAAQGYQLEQTLQAPAGMISGQTMPDGHRLMLVDEAGRAGIYVIGGDRLELEAAIEGEGYRVVAGPAAAKLAAWRREQRADSAQALRETLLMRISQNDTSALEPELAQLEQLGHPAMALELRAQAAAGEGNPVAELSALHRLAQLTADAATGDVMLRYVELLEGAGLFQEALAVQQRTQKAQEIRRLSALASALAAPAVVIKPSLPLAATIEAATVVGRPFSGAWVWEESGAVDLGKTPFSAADVAGQYEALGTGKRDVALPEVTMLRWLSPQGLQHRESILFHLAPAGGSCDRPHLAVAIHIRCDGPETRVVRSILFIVPAAAGGIDVPAHNQATLAALQQLERARNDDPHLRAINRAIILALRSLRTRAVSPWPHTAEATL
ncbi:MAG: hypothetical protein ABSH20_17670 [Tepidisphaeraceae bacterium]